MLNRRNTSHFLWFDIEMYLLKYVNALFLSTIPGIKKFSELVIVRIFS